MDRDEYVEAVLRIVESIPAGRVMSYGAVAEVVGVGGPRQVGKVLADYGGPVPWWRVVRADGTAPRGHERAAGGHYRSESTPLSCGPVDQVRVDMARAMWSPGSPPQVR